MKQVVCFLMTAMVLLPPSTPVPIAAASIQSVRPIYFSDWDEMNIAHLLVREPDGQVHSVFADNNEGFFDSVSPDGNTITFLKWNWHSPHAELETLWLGDLRRGVRQIVGSAPGAGAIWGTWSPDGRYLLISQLQAIAPLWAGYNYGFKSIYNMADQSTTQVPDLVGFVLGWYPDGQHILAWREDVGYFKYSVTEQAASRLVIPDLEHDVKQHLYSSSLSPTLPYLAVANEPVEGVNIYDANTGSLVQRVRLPIPDNHLTGTMAWSPNGQFLALGASDSASSLVAIWSLESSGIIAFVRRPDADGSSDIQWSPDSWNLIFMGIGRDFNALYLADIMTSETTQVYGQATF